MDDESLEVLLREAGRSTTPLREVRPGLAERVRQREAGRRRRRRVAAVVTTVVLLVGAVWGGLMRWGVPGQADRPGAEVSRASDENERLRMELARLDAEVRHRQQIAERLLRAQTQRPPVDGAVGELEEDTHLLIGVELEKAAFLMVDYAQQRAALGQSERAMAECRKVLRQFPDTAAAGTARKLLERP